MSLDRRAFLGRVAVGGLAAATVSTLGLAAPLAAPAGAATWRKRLTGADLDTNHRWQVAGADLGIPYVLENGSIGYLFGDTFNTPFPEGPPLPNDWRSPVMLRSNVHPGAAGGVVFDSAARVAGNGRAPELMHNGHNGIGIDGVWEVTVIPNDGISFPETGRQLVSYMSIQNWTSAGPQGPHWKSNYAGLAFSDNGNDFVRIPLKWWNSGDNTDPFQMWTMQRDGQWVYVFSVRSGRQQGPMMLRRVHWERMFDPGAYEGWGWNGTDWGWDRPCTPILTGIFGEPSVRRLADGTWVMAYLNGANGCIVTRTAPDRTARGRPRRSRWGGGRSPGSTAGSSTRGPPGAPTGCTCWCPSGRGAGTGARPPTT
jgi:hypothetical protein